MRFVYGDQYFDEDDQTKTNMKEVVLMTAEWDDSKPALKGMSLML